jgi:hypothetical protein
MDSVFTPKPDRTTARAGFRGGFTADAHGLVSGRPRAVHGQLDQAQHGGLPGVVEFGERAEHTVRGHGVLGEVVGAQGREVDLLKHTARGQGH